MTRQRVLVVGLVVLIGIALGAIVLRQRNDDRPELPEPSTPVSTQSRRAQGPLISTTVGHVAAGRALVDGNAIYSTMETSMVNTGTSPVTLEGWEAIKPVGLDLLGVKVVAHRDGMMSFTPDEKFPPERRIPAEARVLDVADHPTINPAGTAPETSQSRIADKEYWVIYGIRLASGRAAGSLDSVRILYQYLGERYSLDLPFGAYLCTGPDCSLESSGTSVPSTRTSS